MQSYRIRDQQIFSLRMPPRLKMAVRDRALVENISQNELIRDAVRLYLQTPMREESKRAVIQVVKEEKTLVGQSF